MMEKPRSEQADFCCRATVVASTSIFILGNLREFIHKKLHNIFVSPPSVQSFFVGFWRAIVEERFLGNTEKKRENLSGSLVEGISVRRRVSLFSVLLSHNCRQLACNCGRRSTIIVVIVMWHSKHQFSVPAFK